MRKIVRCYANNLPYKSHRDKYWAEKELTALCQKFKREDYEVFQCGHCYKWHVRRVVDES